jgi:hypothetical protein
MKLYLDDLRDHPQDWVRAHTAAEAKDILMNEDIEFASLDHDLEGWHFNWDDNIESGYDVVKFMTEHNIWPALGVRIHTDNFTGRRNMAELIEVYSPYTNVYVGKPRTGHSHNIWPSEGDIVIYKP